MSSKLPLILPTTNLSLEISEELGSAINFADPYWHVPQGIDLLIGTASWALAKLEGSKMIGKTRLQNSIFGFVVQGAATAKGGIIAAPLIVNTLLSCEKINGIRNDFKAVFEYEQAPDEDDNYVR